MALPQPSLSILTHFAHLEDPRLERSRLHDLLDILTIALCAVLAGADGWEDIEEFGQAHKDWLSTFLRLPNGIPSHDTFRRVFGLLDPDAFQECFLGWVRALGDTLGLKHIAIDGKTLKRSFDRAAGKSPLHLVSAWAVANGISLGQQAVSDHSNEITAIPRLLELLDLSGALVTIDAMGCQKDLAARIHSQGGDYLLSVKGNQGHLFEDVQQAFAEVLSRPEGEDALAWWTTVDLEHGRQELRQYAVLNAVEGIRDRDLWPGLQVLCRVYRERDVNGQTQQEVAYYISSRKGENAQGLAEAIRGHWSIENQLHWVLDVTFNEDQSRIRTEHGPENLARLRRLAVSLLKQHPREASVRKKRLRCGWDKQFLLEVLFGK